MSVLCFNKELKSFLQHGLIIFTIIFTGKPIIVKMKMNSKNIRRINWKRIQILIYILKVRYLCLKSIFDYIQREYI